MYGLKAAFAMPIFFGALLHGRECDIDHYAEKHDDPRDEKNGMPMMIPLGILFIH